MFEILKKEELAANIFLMDVKAPRVAKSGYPGQFVIVKIDSKGERIPLTICDYDREAGIITIVFQTVGASTKMMARLETGDYFQDVVGPLGRPSELIGLTPEELKRLPDGARLMTLECGLRFLTDYLQGDPYFATSRPGQNLDRCRTQMGLVQDMENKWDAMAAAL